MNLTLFLVFADRSKTVHCSCAFLFKHVNKVIASLFSNQDEYNVMVIHEISNLVCEIYSFVNKVVLFNSEL